MSIEHATVGLLLANILLVVVTGVYVYLTWRIVDGNQEATSSINSLANTIKTNSEIQSEMLFMRFVEIIGNPRINKVGFDRAYPQLYARWVQMGVAPSPAASSPTPNSTN